MRFLHLVRSLRRETGGVAEAVRQLARAQRRNNHSVTIVSLDGPSESQSVEDLAASSIAVVVLGTTSRGYGFSRQYVPWLRRHAGDFDCVVVHGLWQYHALGAWRALHGGSVSYVVYPHGMLDVWFKRTHRFKHLKKWLYWPWADYRVLRDAAAVCFTTEEERLRARQSFWLYRATERIAPLGLEPPPRNADAQRAAFAQLCPPLAGARFLLFLGRIHPKKAPDLLIRAYASVYTNSADAPKLVFAGPCADLSYRLTLEALARSLGVSNSLVWLPMVGGDAKWGAIRGCEAFVLLSHQENFGVAVVEALACGRPVIISDQVNIWREVAQDGAGIIQPDTAQGAVAALREWAASDDHRREALSAAATQCFTARYSIEQAASALDEVVRCTSQKCLGK